MRHLSGIPAVLAVAVLAGAVVSCSDLTAPTKTVHVTVTVQSLDGPRYTENAQHEPHVSCRINLQAVGTGSGTAHWSGATIRFYVGASHKLLVDSATFDAADIGNSWSESGGISGGEGQTTYWDVNAAVPFYIEFVYRYRPPHRGEDSTKTGVYCGNPAQASAAPPTVSQLIVTPPSGELPAGAPLTLTYSAAAAAGLWRTDVVVSGPCDAEFTFNEEMKTSVTRTIAVPIPGSCALGVPITIEVYAIDALAQSGSRMLTTPVVLTDREPPTLYITYQNGYGGAGTIKGDFFSGETIPLMFTAYDNHALRWFIWEETSSGTRDSIPFLGTSSSSYFNLPLRAEWSGPIQLRFFARDAAGLLSKALSTLPDSIRVHPIVARPTRRAALEFAGQAFVIDAKRNVIYVGHPYETRIRIVSMATLQVTGTIQLPSGATDLDLSASGDSLVVASSGGPALQIVDLLGATPAVSTIPLGAYVPLGELVAVRVGSNGRAYATARLNAGLLEVNLADGSARSLPLGAGALDYGYGLLERSTDHSVLAINSSPSCVQRYDVTTDAFSACTAHRVRDTRPVLDATGTHIAMGLDVFDQGMQLLPKAHGDATDAIPAVALSPDGSTLYVALYGKVARVRTSDGELLDGTPNPVQPWLMRMTPDGSTLVSFVNYGTEFSLIDYSR